MSRYTMNRQIWGQRFVTGGMPAGSRFLVAADSGEYAPQNPSVGVDADGDFVVVWQNGYYGAGGLWAQHFDSAGLIQGPAVPLTPIHTAVYDPSVAMDPDGNYVVAWGHYDPGPMTTHIYAQQFDPTGAPLDAAFEVSGPIGGYGVFDPAVGMDADGDLVFVWQIGMDGSPALAGRLFDASALPTGPTQMLTYDQESGAQNPSVAMDADGGFIVAWSDDPYGGYGYSFGGGGYGSRSPGPKEPEKPTESEDDEPTRRD